ncbi:hypothetical protein ACFL15_00520 [Patescibacteria group bacterium]
MTNIENPHKEKYLSFSEGKKSILESMTNDPANCDLFEYLKNLTEVKLLRSRPDDSQKPHTLDYVFDVGLKLGNIHYPVCPLDKNGHNSTS